MHIRAIIFPAAALALCMAAPALAADDMHTPPAADSPFYSPQSMITADVTGSLGWAKAGSISSGEGILGVRMNMPLHDGWNLEPDLGFASLFDPSATVFGGVAHVYKNVSGAALGAYAGGFQSSSAHYSESTFMLGGEMAFYTHPKSIFGATLAYGWVSDGTSFPLVGGHWDYFFTPDLKGSIEVDWIGAYSGDPSSTIGKLTLTKHWAGTPWSAFLSGAVGNVAGVSTSVGMIGVTWAHDAPGATLYQHDRSVPFKFVTSLF